MVRRTRRNGARRNRPDPVKQEIRHINRALGGEPIQVFCPPEPPRLSYDYDVSRVIAFEIYEAWGKDASIKSEDWFGCVHEPAVIYIKGVNRSGSSMPMASMMRYNASLRHIARFVNSSLFPGNLTKNSGYGFNGSFDPSTMSFARTIRFHSFSLWGNPGSTEAGQPVKLGVSTRVTSPVAMGGTVSFSPFIIARDEGSRFRRSRVKITCPHSFAFPFDNGGVLPDTADFPLLQLEFGTLGNEWHSSAVDNSKHSKLLGLLHVSFTATIARTTGNTVSEEQEDVDDQALSESDIEVLSLNSVPRTRIKEVQRQGGRKH